MTQPVEHIGDRLERDMHRDIRSTQQIEPVTQAMHQAYVNWEPPCQFDAGNPVRALGLIRAAFFAGWLARTTPAQSQQITLDEDELTEILDDSIDMDWTGRVGARAIIRHYERQSK